MTDSFFNNFLAKKNLSVLSYVLYFLIIILIAFFYIVINFLERWLRNPNFFWKNFITRDNVEEKAVNGYVLCPLRNHIVSRNKQFKKYDVHGKYTEEFIRIKLIYLLLRKGYKKDQFLIEHKVKIGHKGKNALVVDLIIRDNLKDKKIILVAEVKKNFSTKYKLSAIEHQLIPAMKMLDSDIGIYYDGTVHSCVLSKDKRGILQEEQFNIWSSKIKKI